MLQWAENNLPGYEIQKYDQIMGRGIFDEAKQAVLEMKQKFDSRNKTN